MPRATPRFRVGCVPYVNAYPLIKWFESLGSESPVDVVFDVPSRLPDLLDNESVQAILVSSYEGLRQPNMRMADGIIIGSEGPVESVRLFSKVPFDQIQSLALDQSSMTSNRLAQVLLKELGSTPQTVVRSPKLNEMLAEADACVLIGDIGMTADGAGLNVLDLGAEWTKQTGLPFVWAGWMGRDQLTSELVKYLAEALAWSGCGRGARRTHAVTDVIGAAAQQPGWSSGMASQYLTETMVYSAGEREMKGMETFRARLLEAGFEDAQYFPELVDR